MKEKKRAKEEEPINLNWGKETLKSSCSTIAFEPLLYAWAAEFFKYESFTDSSNDFMTEPHFTGAGPEAQRGEVTRAGMSFAVVN